MDQSTSLQASFGTGTFATCRKLCKHAVHVAESFIWCTTPAVGEYAHDTGHEFGVTIQSMTSAHILGRIAKEQMKNNRQDQSFSLTGHGSRLPYKHFIKIVGKQHYSFQVEN